MAEFMRVAALTGYFPTMRQFGADPRPLMREVGLSPELLSNPEQLISARAAVRLLERSAQVTGCVTFGLHMAEGRSLANLGAISLLIAHQPTLRQALAALTEFRNRVNSTLVLDFEESGGEVILREEFSLSSPEPSRQASNLALGVIVKLCSSVLGEHWGPLSACFSHDAPPRPDLAIFNRLFHCRPEFNASFNALILDAGDLDRPNLRADAALAQHARQLIDAVLNNAKRSVAQEVEQLIIALLPSRRATVQTCADTMGMTVRTLQRLLDADGRTFNQLLNQARMQLSVQYLSNPRIRITDVADMLGYSSIGAFTRWHGQAFGVSPKLRRNAGSANT